MRGARCFLLGVCGFLVLWLVLPLVLWVVWTDPWVLAGALAAGVGAALLGNWSRSPTSA